MHHWDWDAKGDEAPGGGAGEGRGGRDACARRHYHVTRHFLPLSLHLAKETVAKSPAVIPARPRSRTPQIADWNFGPTPLPTDLIPASVLYFPILGSCLYPAPCPCPLPLPLPLVITTHPPLARPPSSPPAPWQEVAKRLSVGDHRAPLASPTPPARSHLAQL